MTTRSSLLGQAFCKSPIIGYWWGGGGSVIIGTGGEGWECYNRYWRGRDGCYNRVMEGRGGGCYNRVLEGGGWGL